MKLLPEITKLSLSASLHFLSPLLPNLVALMDSQKILLC